MKNCITIALSFFSALVSGQTFDWLKGAGGTLSDKGTTIVYGEDGFIYETGYYNEEAQFGTISVPFSNPHSKEVYVAKMDASGNYIWVKTGSNYYDDRGLGMCLDEDGNIYVTGTCWGGLTFGSLSVYNPSFYTDQIFVLKLDNNGNEIWLKNAGVEENGAWWYNDDHGQNLASDRDGNIYVTGFLSNNGFVDDVAHFDDLLVPIAQSDSVAFLAKMTTDGDWQWVKTFDGIFESRDNGLAVDNQNNAYVTGGFTGTAQFGSSSVTSEGGEDIYCVKYDPLGNFQWVTTAGSSLDDRGNGIVYGNDGHMYITGEFRDSCVFGTSGIDLKNFGGPGGKDIFVAKINKSGDWIWAKKAGSKKGGDKGTDIVINHQGNLFLTGQFSGEAKFGPIDIDVTGDSIEVFVAAIDTLGKWRWVMSAGGSGYDAGMGITTDDAGCDVYVTGYYMYTMDIPTETITAYDRKDIFTLKISDACFDYDEDEVIDPNPDPGSGPYPIPEPEADCFAGSYNVITPNNDGQNDIIQFSNDCSQTPSLIIVNRWGNIVYESNEPSLKWDGKEKQGNIVPEGVYFWTIRYISPDGNEVLKQGTVSVFY